MATEPVKLVLGVDPTKLPAELGKARRSLAKWGREIGRDIGRSVRGALGSLAGIAGIGGIADLAGMARGVMDYQLRLTRLEIAGKATSGQMVMLRRSLDEVAKSTGVSQDQLTGGLERFVALTGDMTTGIASLETLARVAQASGSSMEDISTAAAALTQNLGIGASEMEQAFSILIEQGKAGAIELKDVAGIAAELTPRFAQFGDVGVDGMSRMAAALQVMRRGFSTAQETATGMSSLMASIVKKQSQLKKAGVTTTFVDEKGVTRLRSLDEIMNDLADKGSRDVTLFQRILGDKEAVQAMTAFAAGRQDFEGLVAAGKEGTAVQRDFAKVAESAAVKFDRMKNTLTEMVNRTIGANLDKIVDAFQKLIDLLTWVLDHKTELVAAWAALSMGGNLAGIGAGVVGLVGDPGSPGAKGSPIANRVGRGVQGAGIGLLVSSMAGLDAFDTGLTTAANGLAGLAGPVGWFAAALGDGLLLLAAAESKAIDAKNKAIVEDEFGSGFWRQQTAPGMSLPFVKTSANMGKGGHGVMGSLGIGSVFSPRLGDTADISPIMTSAGRMGATKDGFIDIKKFGAGLKEQKSLTDADRSELMQRAAAANMSRALEVTAKSRQTVEVVLRWADNAGDVIDAKVGGAKDRRRR